MKKDKSKVGAEPRIKHCFTYREGFHIGVHRDEWGLFDSNSNPYCFVNGYFFTYGRWFINRYKNNLTKDTFNNDCYCGGINNGCFGVIDRKRKIAVIKKDSKHSIFLEEAIPNNYTIIKVLNIDKFDITNNLHYLYTQYCKYLIECYCLLFSDYYKVCNNNRAKVVRISDYRDKKADEIKYKLKTITSKHNISKTRDLFNGKEHFINISESWTAKYIKVKHPTINQIINDAVFTDEQKAYIKKCELYSEYRNFGIVWKDIITKTEDEIKNKVEEKEKEFAERWRKAIQIGQENKEKAVEKSNSAKTLEDFRRGCLLTNYVIYKFPRRGRNFSIHWMDKITRVKCFKNIQLKLDTKRNIITTSNNASVSLEQAIILFNVLYDKYFSHYDYTNTDDYFIDFTKRNIKINYYNLRHICFTEKKTDNGERLGYMEWRIQIGCHTLWLDDIKEFCRYYHLEDRVHFDCSDRNINQLTNK